MASEKPGKKLNKYETVVSGRYLGYCNGDNCRTNAGTTSTCAEHKQRIRNIMANEHVCLIWGNGYEAAVKGLARGHPGMMHEVHHSPRAGGNYRITREAVLTIEDARLDDSGKARLTTWLIDQRNMGVRFPLVTADIIEEIRRKPSLPVHERADRLLRFLAGSIDFVGYQFNLIESTYEAYAWSESADWQEVDYFLNYLKAMSWIRGQLYVGGFGGVVTVAGHNRIAAQRTNADSSQAFVAMWFHDETNTAYEQGIKLGIESAGYRPLRIDQKPDLNKIDDEIIAEIRRSRFLIADFTHGHDGARGGVYFEAGFAHGLGLPVIYTCRKDMVDKLHFDTRQYAHIVWDTPEDLRNELKNRIMARIGEGPGVQTNLCP